MDSDVRSVVEKFSNTPAASRSRIPDVVLRVLPDGRVVEVQVSRTARVPATDSEGRGGSEGPAESQRCGARALSSCDEDAEWVSRQLDALAGLVGDNKRGPGGDVGPDFARSVAARPLDALIPEEGAALVRDWISVAFARAARTEGTYRLSDDDGEQRSFHVTIFPGDSDGLVTIRDITVAESCDLLEEALEHGELTLKYAPCLDALGFTVGAHAVLFQGRGGTTEEEEVLPAAAIGTALRIQLDEWAVHSAVRHVAGTASVGLPMEVSVAVSEAWLHRRGTPDFLAGILECYGAMPANLRLRAHAGGLGRRAQRTGVQGIRALGCQIDVMGLSPGALQELQPAVDGWVLAARDLSRPPTAAAAQVIAAELDLSVVVTEVDTLRNRDALAAVGFTRFEGPCFRPPTDGQAFVRYLRACRR